MTSENNARQQAIDEDWYTIAYANTGICFQEHEEQVVPLQRVLWMIGRADAFNRLKQCFCPPDVRVGINAKRICAHAVGDNDIHGQPIVEVDQFIHPDPFLSEAIELHSMNVISHALLSSARDLAKSITTTDNARRKEISLGIAPCLSQSVESDATIMQKTNHIRLVELQRKLLEEINQYLVDHDERFAERNGKRETMFRTPVDLMSNS